MDNSKLIKKWIKRGLSEDEIELRLKDMEVPEEVYDSPASPAVLVDSPQGILTRVVKTIDLVDDNILVEADKAEKSAVSQAAIYTDTKVGVQAGLILDNKNAIDQNEKKILTNTSGVASVKTEIAATTVIANEAKFSATDAIVKADSAISEASSAQSVAGTANIHATEAKTAATSAETKANTAITDATAASTAASAADAKATTAQANAANALVIAGTKMQDAGNSGSDGQTLEYSGAFGEPRWVDVKGESVLTGNQGSVYTEIGNVEGSRWIININGDRSGGKFDTGGTEWPIRIQVVEGEAGYPVHAWGEMYDWTSYEKVILYFTINGGSTATIESGISVKHTGEIAPW